MASTTTNVMNYPADGDVTITLASLATSSTFVAGRESNSLDNSSNLYLDRMVSGQITVGTTPTVNTQIRVYAFSTISSSDGFPDVMDGVDSNETVTSVGVGQGYLRPVAILTVDSTTSDRAYSFSQISLASVFGGWLPKIVGFFVAHNTGVNLNATAGNHFITTQPIVTLGNTA